MEERAIWSGTSSQVLNLVPFCVCFLLCWLVVPIFVALWLWLDLSARKYEVTTERIRITKGVFSRRTDELELYRVKDTTLVQPFFLRLFGLANVVLTTSDRGQANIVIEAIPNASELREEIRRYVEARRDQKGVREFDVGR